MSFLTQFEHEQLTRDITQYNRYRGLYQGTNSYSDLWLVARMREIQGRWPAHYQEFE